MVGRYVIIPIYVWSMEETFLDVTGGVYWTLWVMTLYYTKCTISNFWNSITVLKLLTVLSKSSTRSSDHLNSKFESVPPAAATCSLVLLANLSFIELFSILILLFCCCFLSMYACASKLIDRAEWWPDWTLHSGQ